MENSLLSFKMENSYLLCLSSSTLRFISQKESHAHMYQRSIVPNSPKLEPPHLISNFGLTKCWQQHLTEKLMTSVMLANNNYSSFLWFSLWPNLTQQCSCCWCDLPWKVGHGHQSVPGVFCIENSRVQVSQSMGDETGASSRSPVDSFLCSGGNVFRTGDPLRIFHHVWFRVLL